MWRRSFLASLAAACAAPRVPSPVVSATPRRLAITMDDPSVEETPLLPPAERDAAILAALSAHKASAMLFVCGMRVDSPAGADLLRRWSAAGHLLGNHSYSHRYFHSAKMTLADFAAENDRGDAVIRPYLGYRRMFRFPFLKEGNTEAKRDGARELLRQRNYTNGHVSIDASDWAFDKRLAESLRRDPHTPLAPFRDAYVAHILGRVHYYDNLAAALLSYSPAHTLLIHHSLLNALFLGDLIRALTADGWSIISAAEAYADPVYRRVSPAMPAGESLIWSLAKANPTLTAPLRYPAEDAAYEQRILDSLP
jgi:peptidoglycan-N-acetylglucosamine deacetylase